MINAAALKDSAYLVALLFHFAEVELLKRAGNDLMALSEVDRDAQIVKARQLLAYEQYAARVLDETHDLVVRELMELVNAAEEAGRYSAVADLRQLGYHTAIMPQQVEAVKEIAAEMIAAVNKIPARALRASLDTFMEAQAYATGSTVLGVLTRRDAAQVMMERLADQGISGFRDRAGRWWRADTYTEMAVRTGTMNVVTTAALHTYEQNGVGYVQVSDSSYECSLCRPYEGKILAIDSRTPTGPVETGNMLTGGRTTFTVAATVDYAKADGLLHPNCVHSLDPFIPGATPENPPLKQDWETYQASQHQRSLERDYRRWIRREAAAITDLAKTEAMHAINSIDDEIETLVNQYPKLVRKPHRESPFTAR